MKTWEEYYIECKNVYNKETKQDNLSPNSLSTGLSSSSSMGSGLEGPYRGASGDAGRLDHVAGVRGS